MLPQLLSPGSRPIHYLRVSVTDRCDMRCMYCMPAEGAPFTPLEHHLTNEEIVRIISVAAQMGVVKVRLTGGEPLVRQGIVDLVRGIKAVPGIRDIALSTNASKLDRYAAPLKAAGVGRVNVSLDTLDGHRFREITRGGSLNRTLAGLEAAEAAGLTPIKVNAVVMKSINDDQVVPLVEMGIKRRWQVRFIEYMPIGCAADVWEQRFVPADAILAMIQSRFPLEELPRKHGDPAKVYRVAGSDATVGVITPVSQHFCDSCNRMRLTADGKIRSCLLVEGEADLRSMLRAGCTDAEIAGILAQAAALKPEWHGMTPGGFSSATQAMREIGG
ncbi:MAG TPA: GTP 3',8-cyclase MoaA [Symbiobacteriaceae bacterium]|jgi:cyclic pyranopterin phosphate synthase